MVERAPECAERCQQSEDTGATGYMCTDSCLYLNRPPLENRDPDGLGCYSDHEHDIRYCGSCSFCGSTEVNVIGHVLPDMERVTGLDPVQAAAMVLHTKTAMIADGILLDYQTAGAIDAVHTALLNEDARAKLRSMTVYRAATVCWKLLGQNT